MEMVQLNRPRQARAMETRARLLAAGRIAFARLGHDGVNLAKDILEPAGVKVGSFYHQFENKTDLLLEILSTAVDARMRAASEKGIIGVPPVGADPRQILRLAVENYFDSLDEETHAWQVTVMVRDTANPRVHDRVLEWREEWAARVTTFLGAISGAPAGQCRPVAEAICAFGFGVASTYFLLDDDERAARRPTLVDTTANFIIGGIGSTIGLDPVSAPAA